MTVVRRRPDKTVEATVNVAAADFDTDASGDIVVTFTDLREVISEEDAELTCEGGVICVANALSANAVTFRAFWFDYDAVADGVAIADTSATDIGIGHAKGRGF